MQAIIFDVDDTLYDRRSPFRNAFEKIFGTQYQIDLDLLHTRFTLRGDDVFEASMNHSISMDDMYIYRIQKAMEDLQIFGISDQKSLEFQHTYAWFQQHITLSPLMRDLLTLCKNSGLFLGVITNGLSDHQREKYDALGLQEWILPNAFLASGDIGINKPDVEIFHYASRTWGLHPKETWYIGDNYAHDMLSSHLAGWHSVWLDRKNLETTLSENVAEITVHSESELYNALCTLIGFQVSINL